MIKLNQLRKLQAVLAGAIATAQPVAAVGYNDKTATTFDGDSELHDLNGVTAVDICPAPAAGAVRQIDYLTIRNYDTAQVTVTVWINEGGTIHNLFLAVLEAGETLGYTHAAGWYVNTADGSRKSGAMQDLSAYLTILAAAAGYQPLDSDLSAIAALATTAYGRAFLTLVDAAAGRTALGLGTAATAASTDFDAAGVGAAAAAAAQAASQPLDSDLTAIAALATTAFGRSVLTQADAAALRTLAGLGTLATQSGTFSGTSSGTNTGDQDLSSYATQSFVTAAVAGLLDFKGSTDCSTNPNYPAALKGDAYIVSVAGKIGGASGTSVDIGDWYVASADNAGGAEASVGASWAHLEHNLVGALLASNNLSDLANAGTARTNLGLGTLAIQSGTFSGTSSGTNTGDQDLSGLQATSAKDASGGYAGLTLFKINFKNALNTFTSFFTNANTAARTYTFPDKDITVAGLVDITGTNSGTNTGDETGARVATLLHAAAAKTTLVDGDEVNGTDSAASFGLIRTTWLNAWTYISGKVAAIYVAQGLLTGSGLTMSTNKLLGRWTAATGAIQEVTISTGLAIDASGNLTSTATFSGALGANNLTGTGTANRIGTAGTNDATADWMFTASGSTKRAVTFQGSRAFGNADVLLAITDFGGGGTALAIDSAGQIITNGFKASLTNFSVTQSSVIGWSGVNSAQGTQVGSAVLSLASSGSGASRKIVIANDTSTIGAMIENSGGRQRVTADVPNATTSFAAITGLGFNAAASGKYTGCLIIKCNDSTAAEGIKFDFNGGSATITSFWAAASQRVGGTVVAGTVIATSLAGAINFSTITGETVIEIDFSMVVNAAGTIIPRFAQNSHSTGTATVELGSFMWTESMPL